MKKIVWKNKSNGQLCVTIPKGSGIKNGDIVNIQQEKVRIVVYTPIIGDLFHYGHLQILEKANELGDFHICGVITDEAVKSYKGEPIANFNERKAIISNLRCVDMVMPQDILEPIENLKKIKQQFPNAKLIAVYGSNWKKAPGQDQIKRLGVEIINYDFYERLSNEKILEKILKNKKKEEKT